MKTLDIKTTLSGLLFFGLNYAADHLPQYKDILHTLTGVAIAILGYFAKDSTKSKE